MDGLSNFREEFRTAQVIRCLMSSQKGNVKRTRPQKHQNNRAFKNDLHDNTPKMKMINNVEVTGVCSRCKDIIEWKIRYKKYKLLTAPKKCTKCEEKTILFAYHVICSHCSQSLRLCAKCIQPHTDVNRTELSSESKEKNLLEQEMRFLTERKKKTMAGLVGKGGMHSSDTRFSNYTGDDQIVADADGSSLNSSESDA